MEEKQLKNNNIEFYHDIVGLRTHYIYGTNQIPESELLNYDPNTILQIMKDSLSHGNGIIFNRNGENLIFGIKLDKNCNTANQTLLNLKHLANNFDKSHDFGYSCFLHFNIYNLITLFFDCPDIKADSDDLSEWKKILSLYKDSLQYTPISFFHLFKTELDKVKAEMVIASEDLYDLKSASRLFRSTCKNYEEYFYQRDEYTELLNSITCLKNINIEKNYSHRVIYKISS